jgi:hypothetical protein
MVSYQSVPDCPNRRKTDKDELPVGWQDRRSPGGALGARRRHLIGWPQAAQGLEGNEALLPLKPVGEVPARAMG